jgi:outer membrane protein OmpA-like peptidoglycan-associated protein
MAAVLGLGLAAPAVLAEPPVTVESIVKALKPPPKGPLTRSFRPGPSRGIAVEGGDTSEEPAPSIDLYVHFEFDQSALTMTDALTIVDALGRALQDPRLANMRFEIVGHTDARGDHTYNMELSRRRAEAVRSRLVQFYGIDPRRLRAEGRGMLDLKDPSRPEDGINRRVQIRTLFGATS